jgi:hypothetical protein
LWTRATVGDQIEAENKQDNNECLSVLDDVTPVGWDAQAEVSYEAAIDGIHRVIGRLSALIADEERRDSPDQDRIDALTRQQTHGSHVHRDLRPGDRQRVAEVRQDCARLLGQGREDAR